jgi:hypothetical protein
MRTGIASVIPKTTRMIIAALPTRLKLTAFRMFVPFPKTRKFLIEGMTAVSATISLIYIIRDL